MSFCVLSLMQDTDDIQVVSVVQKINDMRATQVLLKVWQYVGREPAIFARCQRLNHCNNLPVVSICLLHRPVLACVAPYFFKIDFSQRRKSI